MLLFTKKIYQYFHDFCFFSRINCPALAGRPSTYITLNKLLMIFFTKNTFHFNKEVDNWIKVDLKNNFSPYTLILFSLSWLTPIFIAPLPFNKMCFNRVSETISPLFAHLATRSQTLTCLFFLPPKLHLPLLTPIVLIAN